MSAFTGRQRRGAARAHQAVKREQAIERNAATPVERTAKFRRDRVVVQAAVAEARAARDSRGGGDTDASTADVAAGSAASGLVAVATPESSVRAAGFPPSPSPAPAPTK